MKGEPKAYFQKLFLAGPPAWFKGRVLDNARHILVLQDKEGVRDGVIPIVKGESWSVSSPNQGRRGKKTRISNVNGDWKCASCPVACLPKPCSHIVAVWGYEEWIPIFEAGVLPPPPSRGERRHAAETAAAEAWPFALPGLLSDLLSYVEMPQRGRGRRGVGLRTQLFWTIYWSGRKRNMREVAGESKRPYVEGQQPEPDAECVNGHAMPPSGFLYARKYGIQPISKNSISTFLNSNVELELLEELLLLSAAPAANRCEIAGIDGTGFSIEHTMKYSQATHGEKTPPRFLKAVILAAQPVPVIPAMVSGEHLGENPWAIPLVEQASRVFNLSVITGDKAYWAKKNFEYETATGVQFFVPPKLGGSITDTVLKRKLRSYLRNPDAYEAWYHRRNAAEGNNDTIKSTAGHELHSQSLAAQQKEILCRGIYHNLRMLHRETFIDPTFEIDFTLPVTALNASSQRGIKLIEG